MDEGSGPFDEGRQAWERLRGWLFDAPPPGSAGPAVGGAGSTVGGAGPADGGARPADGGGPALAALADVGRLRRLLDQAELTAVKAARRHGLSWAEIATRLGVTRQSAWERWRDLDEVAAPRPADRHAGPLRELADQVAADLTAKVTVQAGRRRRGGTVLVPSVVGMSWDDARSALMDARLVAVGPDPDGPPLAALGWPSGMVTDQSPEAGARVPPGSPVTVWLDRGDGGSGVREPRRPKPAPRTAREIEPTDEAVG